MTLDPLSPFGLSMPGRIAFGRGARDELGAVAAGYGARAILVHGRDAARADWARAALDAAGVAVVPLACTGEPDLPALRAALTEARGAGADLVVACGGGAVLDMGKALAALIPGTGDPLDHLEGVGGGAPLAAAPLPMIAVPTTAGTGSEVTKNAVIGAPEHRRKVSLRDARMVPVMAIVDPTLTDGCPWSVTRDSGLDAVTQVIEPFVSVRANPLTDALCEPAIVRGLAALRVLAGGENARARDDMALVSFSGGLALANAGLGIVHGLAGPLGGLRDAPHGAICATLLPHALAVNAEAVRDTPFGVRLARVHALIAEVFGCAERRAPEVLADWMRDSGVPSLRGLGFDDADLAAAADAAPSASSTKGNPVVLAPEAIREILSRAA